MAMAEETVPDEKNERAQAQTSPYKPQIVWNLAAEVLLVHIGGLYGLWLVLTFQCSLATTFWSFLLLIYAGVSVTMGVHRLWSHRSFKATTPLKIFLLIGHIIAGQINVWTWAKLHRVHHKYSDTDADPHNASRGFWFSHIGWYVMRKHPEVKAKEKLVDMSDIDAEPWVMHQKKYYKPLYIVFALLIPVAVPCLCWGETFHNTLFVAYFCRFLVGSHGISSVNSVAHLWGTRPYTKNWEGAGCTICEPGEHIERDQHRKCRRMLIFSSVLGLSSFISMASTAFMLFPCSASGAKIAQVVLRWTEEGNIYAMAARSHMGLWLQLRRSCNL